VERVAKTFHQALFGQRSVARLAAFLVDDDTDLRPEPVDHPLALHRTEGRRGFEIEPQLHPRVGPVGVLATGSARWRERDLQLVTGDSNRAGYGQDVRHGIRLA
jgi:hypothetical protein